MKRLKKLIVVSLLLSLLLCGTAGCYPLRIAQKPDSSGGLDVMNTEIPEETLPAVSSDPTEIVSEEPDATPDVPLTTDIVIATDAPVDPTVDPTAELTVAPSQSSGTTPNVIATPTPTPRQTPTPSPTPAPTPEPTPTPDPTPTPNNSDFADFSSGTINGYGNYTNDMFGRADLTMINFWATWCGPCIEELPHIQQLASTYAGRVQIVTVLYDSSTEGAPDTALAIMDSIGFNLPVIRCNSSIRNAFVNPYGVSALPATFFVDSNGSLVRLVNGSNSYNSWCSIINGLL